LIGAKNISNSVSAEAVPTQEFALHTTIKKKGKGKPCVPWGGDWFRNQKQAT